MSAEELQVWQYWEGPMPAYIELCLETVRRHYPGARLLDRASFEELWTTDRDVPIDHLGVHHRADFVRAYVLRHHGGGLWLDSDYVALRRFHEFGELPPSVTFAGYRDGGDFVNGLIFSRPGDPVLDGLYARICDHLRRGAPITWLEIGSLALRPEIDAHLDCVWELDPDLVSPIPWHQFRRFEEPGDAGELVSAGRCGVMLSNASATDDLRAKRREEVLGDDSLIADLIRLALAA
ncbi:MAG TPA: hypothetical protein VGO80_12785 [Solirubrobacteraceae bacterium]|jgi:hypothetical protein|nr:hypothetical protein [Solirubrobacteraceae bacterium]